MWGNARMMMLGSIAALVVAMTSHWPVMPKKPGATASGAATSGGCGQRGDRHAGGRAALPPTSTAPPPKRFRSGAGGQTCAMCDVKPDNENWARYDGNGGPVGDACKQHWQVYLSGYQLHMEWADFVSAYHDPEQQTTTKEVDMGAMVLAGERKPPWFPHEATEEGCAPVVAKRQYIGLPRALFAKQFGKTPAEAGITETDLQDEDGSIYKGVRHPMKPWVEYEVSHVLAFKETELLMDKAKQVRTGQPKATLDFRREDKQKKSKFLAKLASCSLTVEDLVQKIGVTPGFMQTLNRHGGASAASGNAGPNGADAGTNGDLEARAGARDAADNDDEIAPCESDGPLLRERPPTQTPPVKRRGDGGAASVVGGNVVGGGAGRQSCSASEVAGSSVPARGRLTVVASSPTRSLEVVVGSQRPPRFL